MSVRSWARDILELVSPTGCVACGAWIPGGADLVCAPCRTRLRVAPWPRCPRCHHPTGTGRAEATDCLECRPWPKHLSAARYAFVLAPPADDIVHALKYEGWRSVAEFAAEAMTPLVPEAVDGAAEPLLVSIPTTARRLRQRGYNQAAVLAEGVSERTRLRTVHALRRLEGAPSQTDLTAQERRRNVRGAFALSEGGAGDVDGADILLVDDVLTTGATAGEAAMVLGDAGAASVTVIAFARALPTRRRRAA